MLFICHTQGLGVMEPEKHDHSLSQQNRYFLEKFFEQIIMVSQMVHSVLQSPEVFVNGQHGYS